MNEDREILQNQYKDISQELNLKTEALRKYRHKVKSMEKEIKDIQGEFETERQDYLETIRKQEMNVKLMSQIAEKISSTVKKECNYRDLEAVKERAIWSEEQQRYRLPEVLVHRTRLPPAGHNQTRGSSSNSENSQSGSTPTSPPEKLERSSEDIIGNYFKPKRPMELLNQSGKVDTSHVFNTWRDTALNFTEFARHKPRSSESLSHLQKSPRKSNVTNFLLSSSDSSLRKPLRLEALPSIDKTSRRGRLGTMHLL